MKQKPGLTSRDQEGIMQRREISVDLRGKTALVTGGAKGIGAAISQALGDCGATLVVNYLTSERQAQALVARFREKGTRVVAIQADVSEPADVERMFLQARREVDGEIDILVNNAGTQFALAPIANLPLEVWNKTLSLNLTGAMLCAQRAIAGMDKKRWGRIVNISSISGYTGGGPGGVAYAATKGGLNTFTKGLAKELGGSGITVNAVAPGVILTELHEKFSTPESLENLRKITPLGRLGQPEDVAGAVLFLVSDSASYITGETIAINGGLRMD